MLPRVVVYSLVFFFTACTPPSAVQPVTSEQGLETNGTLPNLHVLPFRRLQNPLDAIAPEDPPVPNRGLVAYIPLPNVALPKGDVLTQYNSVPGTSEAAPGVRGSALVQNYSAAFGQLEGWSTRLLCAAAHKPCYEERGVMRSAGGFAPLSPGASLARLRIIIAFEWRGHVHRPGWMSSRRELRFERSAVDFDTKPPQETSEPFT